MKYWAILKDSFLETIDFWLFYVLLGLATLLILACASFTYHPLANEATLAKNLGEFAGPDFDLGMLGLKSQERWPQAGDAAMTVAGVTDLGGGRARVVLRPDLEHRGARMFRPPQGPRGNRAAGTGPATKPAPPAGAEGQAADAAERERREKVFGQALATAAVLRKKLRTLATGDGPAPQRGQDLLLAYGLAASAPVTTDQQWGQALGDYLNTVEGVSNARLVQVERGAGPLPTAFTVEADIDWEKIPYRRQLGWFFGLHKVDIIGGKAGNVVTIIQQVLVDYIAGIAGLIVAVIATAGFVPNMLQKGTLDFLLVKPIRRPTLLISKYLGGLLFVLFIGAYLVFGTWVVLAFNSGNWAPGYLLSVFILVWYFAILYALSVLTGVLTRSPLVAILVTLAFWFVLTLIQVFHAANRGEPDEEKGWVARVSPPIVRSAIEGLHYVLPRPGDISLLNAEILATSNDTSDLFQLGRVNSPEREQINWTEAVATSFGFIAVTLGLACWRFAGKDY